MSLHYICGLVSILNLSKERMQYSNTQILQGQIQDFATGGGGAHALVTGGGGAG